MSDLGTNLSKFMRNFRDRNRQSQEWLADRVSLSRATVNRWEGHGAGAATLDEVGLMSAQLSADVSEMLGIKSATAPSKDQAIDEAIRILESQRSAPRAAVPADILEYLEHAESDVMDAVRALLESTSDASKPTQKDKDFPKLPNKGKQK